MDGLNYIINSIFDFVFFPFGGLSQGLELILISVLAGIVMLIVFKRTSDQQRIKRAKNLLKGHLLEMRLYQDDISLSLSAVKNIFLANFAYLRYAIKPMLFLMVPVLVFLIQLGARYEHRPLYTGESTILSLRLRDHSLMKDVKLELPEGLVVETPALRILSRNQIDWRIKASKTGQWQIEFTANNESVTKRLLVGDDFVRLAPARFRNSPLGQIMNSAEPTLSSNGWADEIRVRYPSRELSIAGFTIHWLVVFFVVSILTGFALKGVFGVEI